MRVLGQNKKRGDLGSYMALMIQKALLNFRLGQVELGDEILATLFDIFNDPSIVGITLKNQKGEK